MSVSKIEVDDLGLKVLREGNLVYVQNSSHRINVPLLDQDFALFMGLLWGDGCISNRASKSWRIDFVEDDKKLLPFILNLIRGIFGIEAHVYYSENKYEVYFNSRIVYEILNQKFGFPDGIKKGKLLLPKQVMKDKHLLMPFLKGLFST
ncbi:MAG: hypothetical protein KGH72_04915, partial [Candidatus Micrarchaeota archaeon]|nr:hypothetical protein [Candidatus Micrarchaeota archaeon]